MIHKKVRQFLSWLSIFTLLFGQVITPTIILAQEVTEQPAPSPVVESTPSPDVSPLPSPSVIVTPEPTPTPQVDPSSNPTPTPSDQTPTPNPTESPTGLPNSPPPSATPNAHLAVTVLENTDAETIPVLDLDPANIESSATLTTDKPDYAPTDAAIISGTGLTPNTTYILTVNSTDDPATSTTENVTTNNDGGLIYTYQLDGNYRPNYSVVLKDESGTVIATTTFTDTASRIAATGGTGISADKAANSSSPSGGAFTALGNITVSEGANSDIQNGTVIFSLPTGWVWNNAALVVTPTQIGTSISTTTTSLTITISGRSNGNSGDAFTISGIQVKATDGASLPSSGYIYVSGGTAVPVGIVTGTTGTNFGSLSQVVGAVSTSQSTVGALPISVPANGTSTSTVTVTLKDQFNNPVSGKTVTLSSDRGATDTISAASGSSDSSGVVTFTVSSTTTGPAIFTAVGDSITLTQTATVTFTDGTPPSDPTNILSSDHTASVASNDNTITMTWTTATDNVGGSGVDGYAYVFNNTAGSICDQGKDLEETATTVTSSALADGSWYFHICTVDNAGNWTSTVNVGPFPIDRAAPGITYNYPTAGGQTAWYNADPGNAIDIDFIWGGGAPLDNAQRKIGSDSFVNIFTADRSSDYTSDWDINWSSLAEGLNQISLKVVDTVGNVKTDNYVAGVSGFLFRKDTVAPTDPTDVASTSHTATPSPDNTIDMAWTVAGSAPGATDTLSGVDGYSYSFTNGATDVPDTVKDAEENAISTTSSVLADGTWYFHLRTRDNAGNWTSTVHAGPFVIDTTAPTLQSFTSTTTNGTYGPGSNINITATYDDNPAAGSSIEVVLDTGVTITLDTISGNTLSATYTVGLSGSGQNSNDLTVSSINSQNAVDGVGNPQSSTILPASNVGDTSSIVVDTTSPDTSSLYPTINPLTGDMYTSGMSTVSATVTDSSSPVTSVGFKMTDYGSNESSCLGIQDLGDPTLWSCQIDTTTLADSNGGTYEMEILATDSAGNAITEYYSYWFDFFDIDNTAPTTSDSGIDTDWHSSDVTVNFNCEDTASGCATTYFTTDGSDPKTSESVQTGNIVKLTEDGEYTIQYYSVDNVGNEEEVQPAGNTVKIDKTTPDDPTNINSTSHTVNAWSKDNTVDVSWSGASDNLSDVAGYSYEWDTNTLTIPDDVSEGTAESTSSPALDDGNSHYFHLRTLDNAGNWTSTVHLGPFFIETATPDQPQATPVGGDYTTDQSVTLSSSDSGGSGLDKIFYTTDGTIPSNTNGTEYTDPIVVNHSLTLKAIAYDSAGNASSIMSEIYGIAPVISAESTSSVSSASITVTWTTDDPATSRVIYDTVSHAVLGAAPNYGYASSTTEDPALVTSHSVAISGLTAGTTYFYRTVSHGSPETVGSEKSTTTTAVAAATAGGGGGGSAGAPSCDDPAPAGAPFLLSAVTSGPNQVILTWFPALDPVTNYVVSYGLIPGNPLYGNPNVGGRETTTYTVSNLSGGTTYYFRVRAGNGCNGGPYSNELSATPGGAVITGPAAGFAPGVLGVTTEGNVGIGQEEVKGEATQGAQLSAAPTAQTTQSPFNIKTILIVAVAILLGFGALKLFLR